MKVFFVILILSISTSVLSQQAPVKIRSVAQQPTAVITNNTSSSTDCSTDNPKAVYMQPLGAIGNPTEDLENLLNAQTNVIKALTTQIETLTGQIETLSGQTGTLTDQTGKLTGHTRKLIGKINQLETNIEKPKQGTE